MSARDKLIERISDTENGRYYGVFCIIDENGKFDIIKGYFNYGGDYKEGYYIDISDRRTGANESRYGDIFGDRYEDTGLLKFEGRPRIEMDSKEIVRLFNEWRKNLEIEGRKSFFYGHYHISYRMD